jgi:lipoate-protein ligase A
VHLVRDRRRPGAENMAIDEALLEQGHPVVRLYGWEPGCVTLGYPQDEDTVEQAAIEAEGLDLARRPTGGGSIYHDPSEITYGVVLPTDWDGLPGDLFPDYRYLSRAVLETFRALGVDASFKKAQGGRRDFCYLREAGVSIVDGEGRKISGGAQRRTKDAVLQHGTVIVERDADRLAELYGEPVEAIEAGVGSLNSLGVDVEREELVDELAAAYVEALAPDEGTEVGPAWLDERAPGAEAALG